MRLHDLVATSGRLSRTSRRLDKIGRLSDLLRRLEPPEIPIGVAYLSGTLPQGRIGIGPAALRDGFPRSSAAAPTLTLTEVDETFERMASESGPGSGARRALLLQRLLLRASREEQDFLARLVLGELRQGSLQGLMVEAVARAAGIPVRDVRRALMLSGDLSAVSGVALQEGASGLNRYGIRLFRPVQPMLAQTAEDVAHVLDELERVALEYKLDGARVQAHKSGGEVRVFTRRLNDVTAAVPEIVDVVRALPVGEIILDGEALALRGDGKPRPFQATMRRFGRKRDVARMRQALPLTSFFFDCLYVDGESLIDRKAEERFAALEGALEAGLLVPRTVTDDRARARSFVKSALMAGHEGVMAKALDAPYESGSRGKSWLKVKRAHTLDLVVLAAEWGHGRRRGWLSNLHLGARDPSSGRMVMLGKTFKGLTDEMLAWQTRRLQELEVSRDEWTVYVRPELVVEVAFNDIQASPHYPGGLALRFARVKSYRPDKGPHQADTIETVRALHEIASGEPVRDWTRPSRPGA